MPAVGEAFFEAQPDLIMGEEAFGHQRSSMRPSSARYSFGRGVRARNSSTETPGPAAYAADSSTATAAFFGTAAQHDVVRPYQYPDVEEKSANLDFVQPSSKCAVFGTEARDGEVVDPEIVRNCPEAKFLREGPGMIYTPDHSKVSKGGRRPTSAPSYTMRGRGVPSHQRELLQRTPSEVAPTSYSSQASALGRQRDSRKTTCRSSSFGRSDRFPVPRQASGQTTSECTRSASTLGGAETGRHSQRRAPSASFGSSSRESSSRARVCRGAADRPPSARMSRPNLPHPPVAPQREQIKFCPGSR